MPATPGSGLCWPNFFPFKLSSRHWHPSSLEARAGDKICQVLVQKYGKLLKLRKVFTNLDGGFKSCFGFIFTPIFWEKKSPPLTNIFEVETTPGIYGEIFHYLQLGSMATKHEKHHKNVGSRRFWGWLMINFLFPFKSWIYIYIYIYIFIYVFMFFLDWSEILTIYIYIYIYMESPHVFFVFLMFLFSFRRISPSSSVRWGLVQGALASAATETLAASCNFLIGRNFLKDRHTLVGW